MKGNNSCFTDCVLLKLDMLMHTSEFYILVLIRVTMTLIQDHKDARKQKAVGQVILHSSLLILMECVRC